MATAIEAFFSCHQGYVPTRRQLTTLHLLWLTTSIAPIFVQSTSPEKSMDDRFLSLSSFFISSYHLANSPRVYLRHATEFTSGLGSGFVLKPCTIYQMAQFGHLTKPLMKPCAGCEFVTVTRDWRCAARGGRGRGPCARLAEERLIADKHHFGLVA